MKERLSFRPVTDHAAAVSLNVSASIHAKVMLCVTKEHFIPQCSKVLCAIFGAGVDLVKLA